MKIFCELFFEIQALVMRGGGDNVTKIFSPFLCRLVNYFSFSKVLPNWNCDNSSFIMRKCSFEHIDNFWKCLITGGRQKYDFTDSQNTLEKKSLRPRIFWKKVKMKIQKIQRLWLGGWSECHKIKKFNVFRSNVHLQGGFVILLIIDLKKNQSKPARYLQNLP